MKAIDAQSWAPRLDRSFRREVEAVAKGKNPLVPKVPDTRNISAALRLNGSGITSVRTFAHSDFRAATHGEGDLVDGILSLVRDQIAQAARYIAGQEAKIDSGDVPEYVVSETGGKGLGVLEWIVILLCASVVGGLLYVSWMTIRTLFLQSGAITDESAASAMSCLTIACTFAVEAAHSLFKIPGQQLRYRAFVTAIGIACGVTWVFSFSFTYANAAMSVSDPPPMFDKVVEAPSDHTAWVVASSLLAEKFIAATLFLYISWIVESCRGRSKNSEWKEVVRDISRAAKSQQWLQAMEKRLAARSSWFTSEARVFEQRCADVLTTAIGLRDGTAAADQWLGRRDFTGAMTSQPLNGEEDR